MADPLHLLQVSFKKALGTSFGDAYAEVDPLLRPSDRADFQANFAMGLGKKLGKSPRDVAAEVVRHLERGELIQNAEVAGPGFINITIRDEHLARELTSTAGDPDLGVPHATKPSTVVVDYSAPNVAKEMHVGHLRSSIIGDALVRVFERMGSRVIRQNHIGDWGTPFGMLSERGVDLEVVDEDLPVERLNALYKEARARFDSDETFADRARRRVVLLQAGDAATRAVWQRLIALSKRYFSTVYAKLGVTLTESDIAGESSYNAELADAIDELRAKALVTTSEGATCVFPPGFAGRDGEPLPLILQKQDGGYGYATTDVAALRHRVKRLGADRILYVIGAPQSQHLAMLFEIGKMAGWLEPPVRAEHVAFGSILGPDKKMFKTRSGESPRLLDLLTEAEERCLRVVEQKSPELDPAERTHIAHAVGIGAIKYADLSNDRIKDYVFDWDRMLALDGNTAPYLMYAHARVRSIFRKAAITSFCAQEIQIGHPAERALALELLHYGSVVEEVATTLEPHRLCTYLFGLATRFTRLFEQCPVLKAETPAQRTSRLALCDRTARTLAAGLNLLGIEAPERM